MTMLYRYLVPTLWSVWFLYWWVSARNVKASSRQETSISRAKHVLPLMLAAFLLALPAIPGSFLNEEIFPATEIRFWIGVAILALGLSFSVWARVHLGRNWSGTVTIKHDHELIQSGPYRFVRHPVYTGLLTALLGTVVVRNRWFAALALVIAFYALWLKLKLEERWLVETFGNNYIAYSSRVAILIPFLF